MGEDELCGGSGDDRISGLPDELLHDILVRLGCALTAARTSVLSRRWRHVWAHLPDLRFGAPWEEAPASILDAIDGALAGYLAPTLEHLSISLEHQNVCVAPGRVARWFQSAAEHMVGEIHIDMPRPSLFYPPGVVGDEAVLDLPACEGLKRIELCLTEEWRVRLQASGVFTALTSMKIKVARMEGSELTALVCTRCPCLRDLALFLDLIVASDVSLHSNSLHSVVLLVRNTRRLEIVAPKLEELSIRDSPMKAHISAPKLAKVTWHASAYDPRLHRFVDVGRSLRLLEIRGTSVAASLVKEFDEVDELKLDISIAKGVAGYESYLNAIDKLPKCKSVRIFLWRDRHALVPSMLHLLKKCSTKKISLQLFGSKNLRLWHSCPPSCSCCLEENHKIDGIAPRSLEEVEIRDFTGSLKNKELVEEVREKVRDICHANAEVKFDAFDRARTRKYPLALNTLGLW